MYTCGDGRASECGVDGVHDVDGVDVHVVHVHVEGGREGAELDNGNVLTALSSSSTLPPHFLISSHLG